MNKGDDKAAIKLLAVSHYIYKSIGNERENDVTPHLNTAITTKKISKSMPTTTKIQKTNPHRIEEIHIHSAKPTTDSTKTKDQHTTYPINHTQTTKNKPQPYWIQGDEQLHNKIDQLIKENNKKKQKAKHLTTTNATKQGGG